MADEAVKVAEVKEKTWVESIGSSMVGFSILLVEEIEEGILSVKD